MFNKKPSQKTPKPNPNEHKKTLSDFRIWAQTKDAMSDDIKEYADKDLDKIRHSTISLCDEENLMPMTNKIKLKTLYLHSQSMNNLQSVSPSTKKMLHDVYSTIKSIKNSSNEIIQLNALYFGQPQQGQGRTISKDSNPIPITDDQGNSINMPPPLRQKSLPKILLTPKQRENKITNFQYATNNFRKQLNKAFMNFNPKIHLENMKLLQEADPDINEDINRLKDVINNDLAEITDKHYHQKKYLEFIKRKKLSIQPTNHFEEVKKADEAKVNAAATTMKYLTTRGGVKHKTIKTIPFFYKTKSGNIFSETKRKNPGKDLRINELEILHNPLRLINDIFTEDNIGKNIKGVIEENAMKKRGVEPNKHKEEYKEQLIKVEESLRDIFKMKLKNICKDEGSVIMAKIRKENELYLKQIPGMKQSLLQEINKAKTIE